MLRDGTDARFWRWPAVKPACNGGFDAMALREQTEIIEPQRDGIARAWDESFSEG